MQQVRCTGCGHERNVIVGPGCPKCGSSSITFTKNEVKRAKTHMFGLPKEARARKGILIYSGVLKYFPDALAAVAEVSRIGNDQHNPGEPLHWDRSKSGDELDALTRHLVEAGTIDTDGVRHSAKIAWRALANLQKEIELDQQTKG